MDQCKYRIPLHTSNLKMTNLSNFRDYLFLAPRKWQPIESVGQDHELFNLTSPNLEFKG